MSDQEENQQADSTPTAQASTAAGPALDLEQLARRIYELLLREIKLENERLGR